MVATATTSGSKTPFLFSVLVSSCIGLIACGNITTTKFEQRHGGYGNPYENNGYNPYNPYPSYPNPYPNPYPPPYPLPPTTPSPLRPSRMVAFSMIRASKNMQQCLNLDTCFLSFQQELTNVNAVTFRAFGAFQAPTSGVYQFSITVTPTGGPTSMISLRKNNQDIISINGTTNQETISASLLLQLNLQDAVYLVVESGDIVETAAPRGAKNSFSGFWISPLPTSTSGVPGQPGSGVGSVGTPSASGSSQTTPSFPFASNVPSFMENTRLGRANDVINDDIE